MIRFGILISLLVCVSYATPITFEQGWQLVLQQSSGLKAVADEEKIAQKKQTSAKSMYLPSLSLTASYTHLDEPVKIEDSFTGFLTGTVYPFRLDLTKQDSFIANLHLLWPLYTGGKIDAAQDIFASKQRETEAKIKMKKDALFLKYVKYYYGVVVAKALYKTRLEAQKALNLHYKNAKALKENAQIAKIELLHAEVAMESGKVELKKAKEKLEMAELAFASLVGKDKEPIANMFIQTAPLSVEKLEDEMGSKNIAFRLFDAKRDQANALVKIKESAWYPTIVGYGNYNLYKDDSILSKSMPKWGAGVMVRFSLLGRSDRGEEIAIARLLAQKVAHLREQTHTDLALLVEKKYKQMQSAKSEYEALQTTLALAKENYKLRKVAFNEGLSTSVELVEAQTLLEGVKTKRLHAEYNYVKALAWLSVLAGDREIFLRVKNEN